MRISLKDQLDRLFEIKQASLKQINSQASLVSVPGRLLWAQAALPPKTTFRAEHTAMEECKMVVGSLVLALL